MFGLGKKKDTEAYNKGFEAGKRSVAESGELRHVQKMGKATGYDEGYKAGKKDSDEKSVAQIDELKKAHKEEVEDLKDELELALQKAGRSSTKVDNSPLTDKEKKKVQKTRAKLLDSLETIVRNTNAQSIRGASIVKEDGDIKMKEINSKDEALTLIRRAKDGEIKIIM